MSFSKSLKKAIRYFAYIGIPTILDIVFLGDFPWLGMTVGTLLKFVRDYLKYRDVPTPE